jgi:hypothetical protein
VPRPEAQWRSFMLVLDAVPSSMTYCARTSNIEHAALHGRLEIAWGGCGEMATRMSSTVRAACTQMGRGAAG